MIVSVGTGVLTGFPQRLQRRRYSVFGSEPAGPGNGGFSSVLGVFMLLLSLIPLDQPQEVPSGYCHASSLRLAGNVVGHYYRPIVLYEHSVSVPKFLV
jgi:hypothetical protein